MHLKTENAIVQRIIAAILHDPSPTVTATIRQLFPDVPALKLRDMMDDVRDVVRSVLSSRLKRKGELTSNIPGDPAPALIDRLSFCWTILHHADILINRKGQKVDLLPSMDDRQDLFQELLPIPLGPEFLNTLCIQLHVDQDGAYIQLYNEFLRSTKPRVMALKIQDRDGQPNWNNIRRLILWNIRRCTAPYVICPKSDNVRIELNYLLELMVRAMEEWAGGSIRTITGLNGEIENQINNWLVYGCLAESHQPDDEKLVRDIAQAFIKCNGLLKVESLPRGEGSDRCADERLQKRYAELERQVSNYADENRHLEAKIEELEAQLRERDGYADELRNQLSITRDQANEEMRTAHQTLAVKVESLQKQLADAQRNETSPQAIQELRDLLKIIDGKYSFDVLHAIQLGDDSILTMKNFVGHLFYALRKKGFAPYPEEEEFVLDYDHSGLYQCLGFEVTPGKTVRVRVDRKGWALRHQNRYYPIRKAQVSLMS